ncbi:phage tail protein [Parvibium lacunae]|uniref:Uncharacterized protein n=1 Tax=Parvibium lacunae TaxID=1888893 RepID=A0A368L7Y7_9BURK|nr:phage tail protein [Parvibium lacunae]RCS59727.1 hypothetical protein DU000_03190 [Parvibium lacunae]
MRPVRDDRALSFEMININFSIDAGGALEKIRSLGGEFYNKVVVSALNATAAKARAEMTRRITAEYNVKAGDVRSQLFVSKASRKNNKLFVSLQAFGRRRGRSSRNVIMFDARTVEGRGPGKRVNVQFPNGDWRSIVVKPGGGVSIKIKKVGGRKLIPGAFIGNKGRTVFVRTGNGRDIKAVETLDVPGMFNTKRITQAVVSKVVQDLDKEVVRSINYYSNKI